MASSVFDSIINPVLTPEQELARKYQDMAPAMGAFGVPSDATGTGTNQDWLELQGVYNAPAAEEYVSVDKEGVGTRAYREAPLGADPSFRPQQVDGLAGYGEGRGTDTSGRYEGGPKVRGMAVQDAVAMAPGASAAQGTGGSPVPYQGMGVSDQVWNQFASPIQDQYASFNKEAITENLTKDLETEGEGFSNQLYGVLKNIGSTIGEGFDMAQETWSGLSPSTKAALIGSAVTAYSASRGWDSTTAIAAQGTADAWVGLMGQEANNEAAMERQQAASQQQAALEMQKATQKGIQDASKGKADRTKELSKTVTEGTINAIARSDSFNKLMNLEDAGFAWLDKDMSESDRVALLTAMGGIYRQSLQANQQGQALTDAQGNRFPTANVDFASWAVDPTTSRMALKMLEDSGFSDQYNRRG